MATLIHTVPCGCSREYRDASERGAPLAVDHTRCLDHHGRACLMGDVHTGWCEIDAGRDGVDRRP